MCSWDWIHILLTVLIVFFVAIIIIEQTSLKFTQIWKHVNTNEVCHLSVHFFTIEKLEGEIFSATTAWGARWLIHHVVKVNFPFTDSCSHVLLSYWLIFFITLIVFNWLCLRIKLHVKDFLTLRCTFLLIHLYLLKQNTGYLRVLQ